MTPRVIFEAGMETGEGPLWDHRVQRLYCVDSTNPAIWVFDAEGHVVDRMALPERIGFVVLTEQTNTLIAGLSTGVFRIDLEKRKLERMFNPEPELPQNRINDGIVDIDGALVFGTLDDAIERPSGQAWRLSPDGLLRCFDQGYIVSNGPCPLQDGSRFLVADSECHQIRQFQRDEELGFRRDGLFCKWDKAWGIPDGIVCDTEGGVWVAHWGGGCVSRFSPEGDMTHQIKVSARQVTKPAFGGPNLDILFLTTANRGKRAGEDPLAGSLFAVETGFVGLPNQICTIDMTNIRHHAAA